MLAGNGKEMTQSEILKTATNFRKGMIGRQSSKSWWFMISAPLEGLLRVMGCDCQLVEGHVGRDCHFWLKLPDGNILDPSADQFKKPDKTKMPPVYIGPRPEWYKIGK